MAPLPPATRRAALAVARPGVCLARPAAQRLRHAAPQRRLVLQPAAAVAAAAAAAPGEPSSGSGGGGLWASFTRLANALTNLFPVFVLGAALWALARPPAFEWFDRAAITPALAVTMCAPGGSSACPLGWAGVPAVDRT